jgi:hypothetical protein
VLCLDDWERSFRTGAISNAENLRLEMPVALGHPLEEPLKIYPVSDLVNSPTTDDARCIEPVRINRDFFERQWWGYE